MDKSELKQSERNDLTSTHVLKTYHVYRPGSTFTTSRLKEIRLGSQAVFWLTTLPDPFKAPQINLRTKSAQGPILASCQYPRGDWSRICKIFLGNLSSTGPEQWPVLTCENQMGSSYHFELAGQAYRWLRTHEPELGGTLAGKRTYKLVHAGTDDLLAVYKSTRTLQGWREIADVYYYVEMGRELEHLSLVAILGIQERIAQEK